MAPPTEGFPVPHFDWGALIERSWTELLAGGFPSQLVELRGDLGQRNERAIRAYTMPTLEAGVAGLALPFLHDDGILFDPSFLHWPPGLRNVVARELAHLLYPGWIELDLNNEYDQMQEFGRVLAPRLLRRLPRTMREVQPMVAAAMEPSRAM